MSAGREAISLPPCRRLGCREVIGGWSTSPLPLSLAMERRRVGAFWRSLPKNSSTPFTSHLSSFVSRDVSRRDEKAVVSRSVELHCTDRSCQTRRVCALVSLPGLPAAGGLARQRSPDVCTLQLCVCLSFSPPSEQPMSTSRLRGRRWHRPPPQRPTATRRVRNRATLVDAA